MSYGPIGVRHMRLARLPACPPAQLQYTTHSPLISWTLCQNIVKVSEQKKKAALTRACDRMRRQGPLLSLQEHVAHLRSSSWQRHRTDGQERPFLFCPSSVSGSLSFILLLIGLDGGGPKAK